MLHKLLLLTILVVTSISSPCMAVDQTLAQKTKGEDVVKAVIDKITASQIFPDDYDFLERIAYVESKFGLNSNTYRPNYNGGIWQVDEVVYDRTKNTTLDPSLLEKFAQIESYFDIDWVNTKWEKLLKPLSSGLAARVFISTLEEDNKKGPIPQTIAAQAKYWNMYYNRRDGMTEANFTDAVSELENKTSTCKGKMDLLVLLDGSGSVGPPAFEQSLNFSAELFASYSSENVRKGFIQFSSTNDVRFSLNNTFSDSEITSKVLSTMYLASGTNTNGGILESVKMYNETKERPGVPKVLCVFTDGESNEGGNNGKGGVPDIDQAQNANITTYAIGIGPKIYPDELKQIAYNDVSHIFELTDFDALSEFFRRLNKETCNLPQKPALNETTSDLLEQNERRYYEVIIPPAGLTISIEMVTGKTEGYFSYIMKHPSSAVYNGSLDGETTFIPPSTSGGLNVFISIKGLTPSNEYTITFRRSNDVGPDPTTAIPEPTQETSDPTTDKNDITTTTEGPITSPVDRTEQQKTKGVDVVKGVIDKIKALKIFPDDYDFLERVAYVESKFGIDESTYREGYDGGIWQVDEVIHEATKNTTLYPSLTDKHDKIFEQYDFHWTNTRWTRLLKPASSGLAARLYISTIEEEKHIPIPQTIAAQAKYWNMYYNRRDGLTEQSFIDAALELSNKTSSCKGKMDLVVLLDGSGSVKPPAFEQSLNFSAELFSSYSSENVRKGFIQFSSTNDVRFSLDNTFSDSEITSKVLNTIYLEGGTNTNGGILESVKMYNETEERPGVPKVLCVFTDGESNEGGNNNQGGVPDIVQAQKANITTYAIGIGPKIYPDELKQIAYNDVSYIFELTDFDALSEFFRRLNKETCNLPQKPGFNESTSDVLTENERRYYEISLSYKGLTVLLNTTSGHTEGYYSYSLKTPSSAIHDGVLKGGNGSTFIPQSVSNADSTVFVALKGVGANNSYTIKIQQGNML